jgi:hypothetical protein
VVHREALPSQQDVQAPVVEAPPHLGQTSRPCPQFCVVGPVALISHRHPYAADRSARPPLAPKSKTRKQTKTKGPTKSKKRVLPNTSKLKRVAKFQEFPGDTRTEKLYEQRFCLFP